MNNVIQTKSYAFAIRIVNAYKFLIDSKKEYVLTKQVLRSGTAIGALVAEAHYAQSSADFVSKMSIALKEANETCYWLNLLEQQAYDSLSADCNELVALLVSIVKSVKSSMTK